MVRSTMSFFASASWLRPEPPGEADLILGRGKAEMTIVDGKFAFRRYAWEQFLRELVPGRPLPYGGHSRGRSIA